MEKMIEITPEQWQRFAGLAGRLSPENLHCDGEISKKEANARYKVIIAEWRKLEKEVGMEVSEEQVWEHYIKNMEVKS